MAISTPTRAQTPAMTTNANSGTLEVRRRGEAILI